MNVKRVALKRALLFVFVLGLLTSAAIYGIDRGLYLGSGTTTVTYPRLFGTRITKTCRHLFITGIVELPAFGAPDARFPGERAGDDPDTLHCTIFRR